MSVSEICQEARRAVGVPEIVILSERDALAYEPSGREVCISVTDPDKDTPQLSPRFLSVLRLAFSDLIEPSGVDSDIVFNNRHAKAVVAFAQQWNDVERVVIHCRAGMSRSPGIAIGLSELFSWGPTAGIEQQHPLWNRRVRREVVRAGREVLTRALAPRADGAPGNGTHEPDASNTRIRTTRPSGACRPNPPSRSFRIRNRSGR